MGNAETLLALGFLLVFIGIAILVAGTILAAMRGGEVEGGGVIIIGPIPIVLATSSRAAKIVLTLAIVLTLITLILYITVSRNA